jgi:DNA-binding SARP family transcriptional activator
MDAQPFIPRTGQQAASPTARRLSGMSAEKDCAGALLRAHRRVAQLTQRQVADAAGVSIGVVRDFEQGRSRRLHVSSADSIAVALGLSGRSYRDFTLAVAAKAACQPSASARSRRDTGIECQVQLTVLGPLTCWRHDAEVALGPPAQRAVLALLATCPGELVHRMAVIDALWTADPPEAAVHQVQRYVSRLRRLLDPGRPPRDPHGLIVSSGNCYRLNAGACQLDLLAFRKLTDRARSALSAGDPGTACDLYEQATRLWLGEPLCDVDAIRQHPAVTGLRRQFAAAVVAHAEIASAIGSYERVIPNLQILTQREPLHEGAHARLMIALAATGQQADALAIFEQVRDRLDAQLGVPPGEMLAEAHQRVLCGKASSPAEA